MKVLDLMIELLLWATPLGLMIDIGGFTLVVLYGHDHFIRPGTFQAPERERPGILYYFTNEGPSDESLPRRRRRWAHTGVGMVVVGFALQIVSSIAAIYLAV